MPILYHNIEGLPIQLREAADSLKTKTGVIGTAIIPYSAVKTYVLKMVDAQFAPVRDTSDMLWPLYDKGTGDTLLGTITFDLQGRVCAVNGVSSNDSTQSRRKRDSTDLSVSLRVLVNTSTTKYKDHTVYQKRDIGIVGVDISGKVFHNHTLHIISLSGNMSSFQPLPNVKTAVGENSVVGLREVSCSYSFGYMLNIPSINLIPFVGGGFTSCQYPQGIDSLGKRWISGDKVVFLGLITCGVKSRWFNHGLFFDYDYKNTFPLPHSFTATIYPQKNIGMSLGYYFGANGIKGIGCGIVFGG